MNKKCNIVIDLLPTYIENMTSSETNKFIEEHLKNCKDCNKIYMNMTEELKKEEITDSEILKEIKKYKNKTIFIKAIIILFILIVIGINIVNLGFRYYIASNAFKKNINYDIGNNYTIEEYDQNIERYEFHTTTYFGYGKMKKMYGNKLLEFYDGKDHYYFNNDNMTYYIEKNVSLNNNINIDIEMFQNVKNYFDVFKLILRNDIKITNSGFREESYYLMKNDTNEIIYIDKDTFFADIVLKANIEHDKEYRITQSNVGWRLVEMPDISSYTLIEKNY